MGEIGGFSPLKERMASAVCAADSTLLVLGERKALELYYQNPDFGLYLVRTIIRRFLDQQVAQPPRPRAGVAGMASHIRYFGGGPRRVG